MGRACAYFERGKLKDLETAKNDYTELASFALDIFETIQSTHGVLRVGQIVDELSKNTKYSRSLELAQLRVRLINRKRRQWTEAEEE